MIPGPVQVREENLKVMATPVIGHRTKMMADLFLETASLMQQLLFTENQIFFIPGSASAFMEAAIINLVKKSVLNVVNGAFGERWHQMAKNWNKEADKLEVTWGHAVDPQVLREKLEEKEYEAVTITHNETSTGVTTPLEKLAPIFSDFDTLVLVDAVSSAGGIPLKMDDWGIDMVIFGTQKCLALPPGLGIAAVSERALEKARKIPYKGWFLNFELLEKYAKKGYNPATPSVSHMFALNHQLKYIIKKEGITERFIRHETLGKQTREWAKKYFDLFAQEEVASNTVTTIKNTKDLDLDSVKKDLLERGYLFATGYGPLSKTTFRIGHMGDLTEEQLKTYLATVENVINL